VKSGQAFLEATAAWWLITAVKEDLLQQRSIARCNCVRRGCLEDKKGKTGGEEEEQFLTPPPLL